MNYDESRFTYDERQLLKTAKLVARLGHHGQLYSGKPYTIHLQMVVDILDHYGYDAHTMATGWTHDLLEDQADKIGYGDLVTVFDVIHADIVEACTGRGENRKARQADIHHKLLALPLARPTKLADRMANVHTALFEGRTSYFQMYQKEDLIFRQSISTGVLHQMYDDYCTMMNTKTPLVWLVPREAV